MNLIQRDDACFYHDESGERLLELFAEAEKKRAARMKGVKQFIFWMSVILILATIVLVKLETMDAIKGFK